MGDYNKPRVYSSEILKDMISKITPEELELIENEMLGMVEEPYTNKEIRTWWLNQTEERRRDMVREYFKNGNSEGINTLYGIMPEEMEEIYNINHPDALDIGYGLTNECANRAIRILKS